MKKIAFLLLLFSFLPSFSQLKKEKEGYYLEDQIYFKFSYDALRKLPPNINQSGFSNNISVGFIRDLPINKRRNFGFGIGLGYGFETYFHNMKIYQGNNSILFDYFSEDEDYKSNKLKFHQIEFPIEIRWRTSTLEKFKFWRVYSGIKFNYLFSSKSKYELDGKKIVNLNNAVNKLQYGITTAAGYGTFNFYIYYGLSNVFKNATFNNKPLQIKEMKFGLQFYIL